jgi:hypothetical protein
VPEEESRNALQKIEDWFMMLEDSTDPGEENILTTEDSALLLKSEPGP